MTPEKKVKTAVVKILKTEYPFVYLFYPVAGGFGSAGIPDIVGCYLGRFFAIECKAGKGKTTALQDKNIAQIREADGRVMVVNEDNLQDVRTMLDSIANSEGGRQWEL
jgi:Holliday junction resolvase